MESKPKGQVSKEQVGPYLDLPEAGGGLPVCLDPLHDVDIGEAGRTVHEVDPPGDASRHGGGMSAVCSSAYLEERLD